MEELTQFINNCGFPIVVACGMFYFMKTELGPLRDIIEKNTIVLEKILTRLGMDGGEK